MAESFKGLKRKSLISAVVKSAVIGVSAGLVVAGILLLSFGLAEVSFHWAYSLLIGVGVALIAGGLCFFILRPNDVKTAKQYDKELSLNERLQTMVEFDGREGDILTLQREDTAEKLSAVSVKMFDIKRVWYFIVIAVISIVILCMGIFVPALAVIPDEPPPDEPPPIIDEIPDDDDFEYDLFMQSLMGELINDLRSSSLEDNLKNSFIAILTDLDNTLKEVDSKKVMKSAVISAVAGIDSAVEEVNTFRAVSGAFNEMNEDIAQGIRDGMAVYNASTTPLSTIDRVEAYQNRIGELIAIIIEESLKETRTELNLGQNEGLEEALAVLMSTVRTALENSSAVETDGLFSAFNTFRLDLNVAYGMIDNGYGDTNIQNTIDTAFKNAVNNITGALDVQCRRLIMNNYVRQRLAYIFGIDLADLPAFYTELNKNGDTSGSDDGPGGETGCKCENHEECQANGCECGCVESSNGGGLGTGDTVYGGNELIYDPNRDEYVKYGDVLDSYYNTVFNRILEGATPEEIKELINEYFNFLYNGIKDGE